VRHWLNTDLTTSSVDHVLLSNVTHSGVLMPRSFISFCARTALLIVSLLCMLPNAAHAKTIGISCTGIYGTITAINPLFQQDCRGLFTPDKCDTFRTLLTVGGQSFLCTGVSNANGSCTISAINNGPAYPAMPLTPPSPGAGTAACVDAFRNYLNPPPTDTVTPIPPDIITVY
jgi:hypothetical protein